MAAIVNPDAVGGVILRSPMRTAQGVVVREAGGPAVVEEILVEAPGPGEVLVRLTASGVCHTDLHAKRGQFTPAFPYLLGHEGVGIVEEVGEGVTSPAVGETVVLAWRAPCGRCVPCRGGRLVFCATPAIAGPRLFTRERTPLGRVLGVGTFCTHTVVAAGQAIPIPADLRPEATCLIGCSVATGVGSALFAAELGRSPGATVAVFGCGAVGISVILGARLAHAARIIAVDRAPRKLEWARQLGATDSVDPAKGDPVKQIRALTQGRGVELAFEAVGIPETLSQAVSACELGGTCIAIGVPVPGATVSLSMVKLFYGRVTIKPTFCGDCLPARDFPRFAEWYRTGALPLDELVTRTIAMEGVDAAFGEMERGETIRSVIRFS